MSWYEWEQPGAHHLKKNARIAELEHAYSVLKRTLTETVIKRDELKAENKRLRDALEEVRDMMGTNLDYTIVAKQALEKDI